MPLFRRANQLRDFDFRRAQERRLGPQNRAHAKTDFTSRFKPIGRSGSGAVKMRLYENQKSCLYRASCLIKRGVTANRHET
jgi:hypothetical protein